MKKIPASEKLRKEFQEAISGGNPEESLLDIVMTRGAAIIVQELLEQEVTDFLGREHYQRRSRSVDSRQGYRNGYEPLNLKTPAGKIRAHIPQVRDSEELFCSRLVSFFRAHSDVLEKLAVEMYARGLSTRDIEDALQEATEDRLLSRTAVSQATEILWEEFEAFRNRDLSRFEVEYLFVDAIYERLRRDYGVKEGVLCFWGITRQGQKVLLHLQVGNRESYDNWLDVLRNLVKRGLRPPTTVTSDGSLGAIQAIATVFPQTLRLRCWVHRLRNFSGKVPADVWPEIKQELLVIRDAPTYDQGRQWAMEFIQRYQADFPTLVRAFQDDLEALLNHLRIPLNHRRHVRSTNLIERSFVEERRRTKSRRVGTGFLTEKAALKLIYAVLIRASYRWRKITFTPSILCALDVLRQELGIREKEKNNQKPKSEEATFLQEN